MQKYAVAGPLVSLSGPVALVLRCMKRLGRFAAFAVVSTVGVFFLTAHLQYSTSLAYIDNYAQSTKDALSELKCSIDSSDTACSDVVTSSPQQDVQAAESQDGKSRLSYPAGFEQFDTSDPKSPYQQGTYDRVTDLEDENTSAHDDVTYMQRLMAWTPYNEKYNGKSLNPVIWQTYKEEPSEHSAPYTSWVTKNKPKWSRTFIPDTKVNHAMDQLSRELTFLNRTFHALPSKIMRHDFLRYVTLFSDGGVYADIDTSCLSSIDTWYAACYASSISRSRSQHPGLVVGVEFDLLGDTRYPSIDGAKVALANYVFAANKGHPALARMISDIVSRTLDHEVKGGNSSAVYEWTGRKAWTETIIAHIQSTVQGFKEADLLGMTKAKVFDDVCVLPVAAFGSGQAKYRNSPDSASEGVMVKHFKMHLWD